jgi:hypothetical protein
MASSCHQSNPEIVLNPNSPASGRRGLASDESDASDAAAVFPFFVTDNFTR